MKRTILLTLTLLIFASTMVFAQSISLQDIFWKVKEDKDVKQTRNILRSKSMVLTSDGGVFIIMCVQTKMNCQMIKYDKDLSSVKRGTLALSSTGYFGQSWPNDSLLEGAISHKFVVPTSDGGVFIEIGNQMNKYDQDLNLVKETQFTLTQAAGFGQVPPVLTDTERGSAKSVPWDRSTIMLSRSIVATPDGGVIIEAGGQIIKYDKDLNIVKQASLSRPS